MILWIKPTVDGLRKCIFVEWKDEKMLVQMYHNARPHYIDPKDIEGFEINGIRINVEVTSALPVKGLFG